jgi:hypothetical protein
MRAILHGVAIAVLTVTQAAATEVFRWVDEDGQVHFGDRPRAADARSIQVEPKAVGAMDPERRQTTRRLLEAFERKRERQREADAAEERREQERARRCAEARRLRRGVDHPGPVYREGADGSRSYLDDGERAAARAQAQRALERWCD